MKKLIAITTLILSSVDLYAQPWVEMVKDICPDSCFSTPSKMTQCNGKIYFVADDGIHGEEPWVTDGTAAGTYMLKDLRTTAGNSVAESFTASNGKTFFLAAATSGALWVTDGTTVGTQELCPHPMLTYYFMIGYNNKLYFRNSDNVFGEELWVSDGTLAGTHILLDINPSGNSSPAYPAVMNGKLYFGAQDGTNGHELWETDGTAIGTKMVADISPGTNSSFPVWMTPMNGKLYFICITASGHELWVSDGTSTGTQLVKNLDPTGFPLKVENMMTDGNRLYFSVDTSSNSSPELYVSDGTTVGTFMLKDINPKTTAAHISTPVVCNGKVFFVTGDSTYTSQLWMTDGTTAGTVKVVDTVFGVEDLTCFNGRLYFKATAKGAPVPIQTHTQVWYTDGTVNHVRMVKPSFTPFPYALQNGTDFAQLDNSLYFRAFYDNNGTELWRLTDFPANVETTERNEFKLYPNPATNTLMIDVANSTNASIRICSITGQTVLKEEINRLHSSLDIRNLPEGVYVVCLQQNGKTSVQKFVKMRF